MTTLLANVETDLLSAAEAGWQEIKTGFAGLEATVKQDLQTLLSKLESDLSGGESVDEMVTALLNLAESMEMPLVLQVETWLLNGLVAGLMAL